MVIGQPITQSLSPEIFAFLSQKLKRPLHYRREEVAPAELAQWARARKREPQFCGCNVTIPHKEKILKQAQSQTPEVRLLGAANVIQVVRGRWVAHNTDIIGVKATLREQKLRLRGKNAVLFGAGGAAKAVVFTLAQSGLRRLWIINRTPARARALARRFARKFPHTEFRVVAGAEAVTDRIALVVNSLPVSAGSDGFRFAFPLTPRALAFDLTYRPPVTPFLRRAHQAGLRTVNGLDMLIWQALATWKIWFRGMGDPVRLKARLKRELSGSLRSRF